MVVCPSGKDEEPPIPVSELREGVLLPEAQEILFPALFLRIPEGRWTGMNETALIRYLAAVAQGHVMLKRGLITDHEFGLFEDKMREKYNLPENSIFRDYRLLYKPQQR